MQLQPGINAVQDIDRASTAFNQWADANFESSRMQYDRLITSAKMKRKHGLEGQEYGEQANALNFLGDWSEFLSRA